MQNLILQAALDGELLVYGHSGAMGYRPTNTMPAFELALEQGAQAIELDAHRSKDGHVVVVHNFTVDDTTNGTGTVNQMTLAELKALDAGSWFDEQYAGIQIPTLDEIFEAFGAQLLINVEIKSDSPETDGVEEAVTECIARHNMQQRVIISAFNPLVLKRCRPLMLEVPLAFLYSPTVPYDTLSLLGDFQTEAYHPVYTMVDADLMREEKAKGRVVNVWTVNDLDEGRRLRDLGVNGIMTDYPDKMIAALKE
ncbi:MAG: glycerophosphodiester phosphodiesterase [Anaerolineae bacterium]|nr:glycerophosphodiester phosphodiesterase [Anaerolineae bacterium]